MNNKELLEKIYAQQIAIFRRLDRIENSLQKQDSEFFGSYEKAHYDDNIEDLEKEVLYILSLIKTKML